MTCVYIFSDVWCALEIPRFAACSTYFFLHWVVVGVVGLVARGYERVYWVVLCSDPPVVLAPVDARVTIN